MDLKCMYLLYPATNWAQAEFCENDADPDTDYCADHDPDRHEPDWDSIRKDRLYGFDD